MDPTDDLIVNTSGFVAEGEQAVRCGLIDDALFDEVPDRVTARTAGG